jgi:uncharacterized protein (TIGR04255 family)
MPFPTTERVRYSHNPLHQVICQLRFPSILKVEATLPAEFQESIRHEFPIFQERQRHPAAQLSAELEGALPPVLKGLFPRGDGFDFISDDREWQVTLTRDFLSLLTSNYSRWEEFSNRLKGPLDSLKQIYRPAFFTRIGLQYQNLIQRSEIGREDTEWAALIQPHLAGILSNSDVGPHVADCTQVTTIHLEEGLGQVRIQHGLVMIEETKRTAYLIDSDFFTNQRTEVGDESAVLDQYHQRAGHLFRWCISPLLHNAMGPSPISGNDNSG